MTSLREEIEAVQDWFENPRFDGIVRLHNARDVAVQRGAISTDYPVAREAAGAFYSRLRELFDEGKQITTFGPYSPGQAVSMKRKGIEGIYLGGWATSAKGSVSEDPGPDLASYPLGQVPDEAAVLVRALLAADRNQQYERFHMSEEERGATPAVDFRPFIIADADTGHGGDAHVRNLVRRFVEAGVPGYHIEDQRPGAKKCGHQAGKVLVGSDEQIKRLNAARFQLDVMGVPGILVARTDAEAATFLESRSDERDQPFILGSTDTAVPTYRAGHLSIHRKLHDLGVDGVRGHLVSGLPEGEYQAALRWLDRVGLTPWIEEQAEILRGGPETTSMDHALGRIESRFMEVWEAEAGLKTFGEAVAELLESRVEEGEDRVQDWLSFAKGASLYEARERAESMGLDVVWDSEHARTPDGFYQIRGGIDYAIAKSLAAAPFADLLWMETKTADLEYAKRFADAIHAEYPDQMLVYNLSPSFNWDTTGMSDEEMRRFAEELGKLGFVFNFITYGGHQFDGLAAEEFSAALQEDGMLALAQLQRRIRLVDSPYRTPQTLVGGPRLDGALTASSGRTATTKAMGKGSTQHQHLVHTEAPPALLEGWLERWSDYHDLASKIEVHLGPHRASRDLLELKLTGEGQEELANIIFTDLQDRRGRKILSIRDQHTRESFRRKRLMTLVQLFLFHRYQSASAHYLTPTEDNEIQTRKMKEFGTFSKVSVEGRGVIVSDIDQDRIGELVDEEPERIRLIEKRSLQPAEASA